MGLVCERKRKESLRILPSTTICEIVYMSFDYAMREEILMSIVDVVSVQSGKNGGKVVEGFTGHCSLLDDAYAYLVIRESGFTMRLVCASDSIIWRDKDGAIDKRLELVRAEINVTDFTKSEVTVYDTVRLGDALRVIYPRSIRDGMIRQPLGVVDRIMIMI